MLRFILTLLLIGCSTFSFAQSPADDLAFINETLQQYNTKKDNYQLMVEGNIIRLKYGRKDHESFRMPKDNAIAYIGPYSTGGGGSNTVYIACKDGRSCMNNGFGDSISMWFNDVSKGVPNMPEVARRTNRWLLSLQTDNAEAQKISAQNDNSQIGSYCTNDMMKSAQNTFIKEAATLEGLASKLQQYANTGTDKNRDFYPEAKKIQDEMKDLDLRMFNYIGSLGLTGTEVSRLYGLEEYQQYFTRLHFQLRNTIFNLSQKTLGEVELETLSHKKKKINGTYCGYMAGRLTNFAGELRKLADQKLTVEAPAIVPTVSPLSEKLYGQCKSIVSEMNGFISNGYKAKALLKEENTDDKLARQAMKIIREGNYRCMEAAALMGGKLRTVAKTETGNPAYIIKIKEILALTDKIMEVGKELAAMLPEDEKDFDSQTKTQLSKTAEQLAPKYNLLAATAKNLESMMK